MLLIWAELAWQVSTAMPLLERGEFAAALPVLGRLARSGRQCLLLGGAPLAGPLFPGQRILTGERSRDEFPWRIDDALGLIAEASGEVADALFQSAIAGNRDKNSGASGCTTGNTWFVRAARLRRSCPWSPLPNSFRGMRRRGSNIYGRALYQVGRFADAETQLAASGTEAAQALLAKVRRQRSSGQP